MPPIVVLHHGFMCVELRAGPVTVNSTFSGIDRAIIAAGHPLIVSRVHPTAGVETRARQLKENVLRQLDILGRTHERVIMVAHSMGGLDARYMISRLGMADRVSALLTITTPHRGSPYADWAVRHLGRRLGGMRLCNFLGMDVQGIVDLTTEHCRRFNDEVPNDPSVKYFSISAARPWHRVPPFAMHAFKVVHDAEGPNDFLVSVKSAKWGEHLGTWPADHLHTMNKRWVIELKQPTGDIAPYYTRAISHVVARLNGKAEPVATRARA